MATAENRREAEMVASTSFYVLHSFYNFFTHSAAVSAVRRTARSNKNSLGDEIANVNFFTTISHTCFKIPKRELTLFNKLDDSYASTAH